MGWVLTMPFGYLQTCESIFSKDSLPNHPKKVLDGCWCGSLVGNGDAIYVQKCALRLFFYLNRSEKMDEISAEFIERKGPLST